MTAHEQPLTRDQIRQLARPGAIHVAQISPSAVKITIGGRVEVYDLIPEEGPDTDTLSSPVGPYTYKLVIDVLRRQAAAYESAVGLLWEIRDRLQCGKAAPTGAAEDDRVGDLGQTGNPNA